MLIEGPLDAARFPGHGLAVLGKYLSEIQALLVKVEFTRVILAFDADRASSEAWNSSWRLAAWLTSFRT